MRTSIKLQQLASWNKPETGVKTPKTRLEIGRPIIKATVLCGFIAKVWGLCKYKTASLETRSGPGLWFSCSSKCCRWQQRQWMLCVDLCIQACKWAVCMLLHTCIFWEHMDWPCSWYDLQMARAGNRLRKRNPGSPKSLSIFWTFATAMHTDHNSMVFCEQFVSWPAPQFFLYSIFFLNTKR